MGKRHNAFLRVWGDWQRNVYSGVSLEIRKSFIVNCYVARMVFFADEYFRDDVLSGATEVFVCEIFRHDDKILSCNHDMDLVIGKALMLIRPCWLDEQ